MDQELRDYAERKGIDPETFNTETHAIVCLECNEQPGLVVTGEYNGLVISCECDECGEKWVEYTLSVSEVQTDHESR